MVSYMLNNAEQFHNDEIRNSFLNTSDVYKVSDFRSIVELLDFAVSFKSGNPDYYMGNTQITIIDDEVCFSRRAYPKKSEVKHDEKCGKCGRRIKDFNPYRGHDMCGDCHETWCADLGVTP